MTGFSAAFLLCLAALLAAATQAATGFGFVLLFSPLLILALDPVIAVQVMIVVNLPISLIVLARMSRPAHPGPIARLALGGLAGMPLGLWAIARAERSEVQIALGALVLVSTAVLMLAERRAATGGVRSLPGAVDVAVGAVSGAMASGLAMPGPPLMIYLLFARHDKDSFRSTLLIVFLILYGASLALHAGTIGLSNEVWPPAALFGACAVIGALAGDRVARHIDTAMVRRAALITLAVIGASTLVAGLR